MAAISATWRNVASAEILQRSSQIICVVGDKAYIFGGELQPREPRDNHVHVAELREGMHCYASHDPPTLMIPDLVLIFARADAAKGF